jgi:putative DNA primase/helicase
LNPTIFAFTPDGDAAWLAHHLGDSIRYDPNRKAWRKWNGTIWILLSLDEMSALVRETLTNLHANKEASFPDPYRARHLQKIASPDARDQIIRALSQRLELRHSDWDVHRDFICTSSGVVGLNDGTLYGHCREGFFTTMLSTPFSQDIAFDDWLNVLTGWFGDDPTLIEYVQVAAGYTLLGNPTEKLLLLLYGPANTGKSTFLSMLAAVFENYVGYLPELWNGKSTSRLHNAFSRLQDVRLVIVPDAPAGTNWGTSEVKTITGASEADHIVAKRLYQDAFTYRPKFTVWAATNHLPQLSADDEAAWARLRVVPFYNQRDGASWDRSLADRAKPDHAQSLAPQILRWLVDGARKYVTAGCLPDIPESVRIATESARTQSCDLDSEISRWIWTFTEKAEPENYVVVNDVLEACEKHAAFWQGSVPTRNAISKAMSSIYGTGRAKKIDGKTTRVYLGCRWILRRAPRGDELISR